MLPGKGKVRRLELGEDATAGLKVVPAGLSERKMPRGAGHEAYPDLILERRQMTAHGRERHIQAASGGRQASGIGDSREHAHGG
jgi:hypothetical protein